MDVTEVRGVFEEYDRWMEYTRKHSKGHQIRLNEIAEYIENCFEFTNQASETDMMVAVRLLRDLSQNLIATPPEAESKEDKEPEPIAFNFSSDEAVFDISYDYKTDTIDTYIYDETDGDYYNNGATISVPRKDYEQIFYGINEFNEKLNEHLGE